MNLFLGFEDKRAAAVSDLFQASSGNGDVRAGIKRWDALGTFLWLYFIISFLRIFFHIAMAHYKQLQQYILDTKLKPVDFQKSEIKYVSFPFL